MKDENFISRQGNNDVQKDNSKKVREGMTFTSFHSLKGVKNNKCR